eukprot:3684442-Prymnesium_polylepis.2
MGPARISGERGVAGPDGLLQLQRDAVAKKGQSVRAQCHNDPVDRQPVAAVAMHKAIGTRCFAQRASVDAARC